uniref:N/A n=1 Tax=Ganoderma boninense TaxID=34458 RepID=A0A5K1JV86_9APHY|nr:N/A [Ganoderma boninense]
MLIAYTAESAMPGSFEDTQANGGDHAVLPDPLSGAVIPASRSSHQTSTEEPSSPVERSPKVRVVEVPRHPLSPRLSQLHTLLRLQHPKLESRRVRAALEDRETALQQYENDKRVWIQRAASYERQLKEIAATHAATEREFRDTIYDRLREIASLKEDLVEKNLVIEGIGHRCDELNTALTTVREELKEEREKSKAEREEEIRNLEARLMSSIQVRIKYF